MKKKLLTDVELRARWSRDRKQELCVEEGTLLTPSARDFIREQGITLRYGAAKEPPAAMTVTPIPTRSGKAVYIDAQTGRELDGKPEEMTHLRGNLLVPKTHPRIEFRGRMDSLMAQIMDVQIEAEESGEHWITEELDELLAYARSILAAEVKEEPLPEVRLMGMDSTAIRRASHQVKKTFGIDHPVPSYQMGRVCVALNRLRTQVREAELSAARAFRDGEACSRTDIIEGLNRMSSCVYILLCRKLAGRRNREEQP